jgi:hypothetical protein
MSDLMDGFETGAESTCTVRPMDVVALRLVSAWAGLMPDEVIGVGYDGASSAHGRLTRVALDAPAVASEVVIPANTRAKRPRMAAMNIHLDGRVREFPLWDHAAAFWSESAVEKFLVPYLAALGGPRAAAVMDDLDTAWNGFAPDRRAFALLLRGRVQVGGTLDLHDLLDVVYVDGEGEQQLSPLRDFLAGCTRPGPFVPPPVSLELPHQAVPSGGVLPTEYQLRVVAEWASALRREPGYFVYDAGEGRFGAPVAACPAAREGTVVIPVYTDRTRADRPLPDMVTLLPDRADDDPHALPLLPHQGDAAFWTSGAVSKVMIPYYAMAYGASALLELAEIHRVWEDRATPAQAETAYADDGVYGLVHLPKSDWGYETASGFVPGVQDMVGAVVARAGEAPRMLPFSEFLGRSR